MDKDLESIQEVRDLMAKAKKAQQELASFDQQKIDNVVRTIAVECSKNSERLAKMAVEETGFGVWQDKVLKNNLGSMGIYEYIKDMKTVGILQEDKKNRTMDIAVPVGVVAGIIPSTNPTSTVMYKSIISIKAGNAIVISPHPNAKNCILETYRIIARAAKSAGAPDGIVQCITIPSLEGTQALMRHKDTGIILATGGEAMVRAAYSSGNPALGVGPGNGPSFIEKSADIPVAIRRIFDSKTFDNGTICASEQSIVTESCIKDKVMAEAERQGGYFMTREESEKVGRFMMRANGTMNPKIVGRNVHVIAEMAGISIPAGARVLISMENTVGRDNPYSREKLCPVLGFYVEDSWEQACCRCIEILNNEGVGHTMTIHSQDESIIREFALKKPVSRLIVNAAGALGGVGATTGLPPAFTLGCGAIGGSATSDNVGPMHLLNIRHVAYGIKELTDLRGQSCIEQTQRGQSIKKNDIAEMSCSGKSAASLSAEDIERITRSIISRLTE